MRWWTGSAATSASTPCSRPSGATTWRRSRRSATAPRATETAEAEPRTLGNAQGSWRTAMVLQDPAFIPRPGSAVAALLGARVDDALGQCGQAVVGLALLVERLLQRAGVVAHPQPVGVGADAAVAGDLVVLHPLRGGDQARVDGVGVTLLL